MEDTQATNKDVYIITPNQTATVYRNNGIWTAVKGAKLGLWQNTLKKTVLVLHKNPSCSIK